MSGRPNRGDLYEHTITGEIAAYRGTTTTLAGEPLLILHSAKWGECRWSTARARRYTPPKAVDKQNQGT